MKKSAAIAITAAIGFGLAQPALAQANDQKLGKVHFETSCKPEAQKHFDRAMLYQHSFWYRASQQAFEETLKADTECGIAHWGIALSLLLNPHVPPPAKNLAEGAAGQDLRSAAECRHAAQHAYGFAGVGEPQLESGAPDIGEVYQHYRGENLPDPTFFRNALVDKFKIPQDKVDEFTAIFVETMQSARRASSSSGRWWSCSS